MIKKLAQNENMARKLYEFCMINFDAPYLFLTRYGDWYKSMFNDVDGQGNPLFEQLDTYVSYKEQSITGYVQYGFTRIGFDEAGQLKEGISYPVIRNLFFLEDAPEDGEELLHQAMQVLKKNNECRIYAFFHYFGMSCYARHGKLHIRYGYIEKLLYENNFVDEHENVYYLKKLSIPYEEQKKSLKNHIMTEQQGTEITLVFSERSKGNEQMISFLLGDEQIGGCNIHFLPQKDIAYLRWIFIKDDRKHQGLGTICMQQVCTELSKQGMERFDTDTAVDNVIAQNFYRKAGFLDCGHTKSYYTQINQENGK